MTNLILVAGIFMYGWAHVRPRSSAGGRRLHDAAPLLALVLAIFLVIQVIAATEFGLTNGRAIRNSFSTDARLIVNLDRMPLQVAGCELFFDLGAGPSAPAALHDAVEDHLAEFQPNSYGYYRQLGPPPLNAHCAKIPASR